MLKKKFTKSGDKCRVTFKVPADLLTDVDTADHVAVLGDWNDWQTDADQLKARKDGSFSTTVSIEAGKEYRFRYLVDGKAWANDDAPDALVPNRFGGQDCVVAL